MLGRNLRYSSADVDKLGPAALDDLLERGDLDDWAPLARAVAADPFGPTASAVLKITDAHRMYGTSALWSGWINNLRAARRDPLGLAALRRGRDLTQQAIAGRLGMTQSDVSKLERRTDIRLSTLRAYIRATGGDLQVIAKYRDDDR